MASNNIIGSLGAGSGIDIASLVTQLTAVERAPQQQRLDTRQQKLEAQISGYGQLKSALNSVQTAMAALGDNDLFNARSVSVPSSDVITANKVAPGAQTGTYKIEVLEVASAHSLAMASQSDRAAALNKSGDLTIRFGEWQGASTFNVNDDRASLKISVAATDSLDTIAGKINGQNAGVQASVLKVDGQFQLMLTSPSGKSNAMEITGSTASLSDFNFNATNRTATQTQAAQNAELKLNGLNVTRESNDIDDVIPGLSFTINKKGTAGESLSFSVTADKGVAEQSIRDFVKAYNDFQKSAQDLVGYSRDKDNKLVRGALAGDSTARTMISRLRETIGGSVPGVQSGFTALTNVGIRTERDGSLSINEKEFSAAISGNFNQFESLFATRSSSTSTAVSVTPGTFANRAVSGTHDVEITQDPTKGQVVGNAVSHADFNATTDTFATALNTSAVGKDYSFKISIDGVKSSTIKLTGTYASADELRADLQSQINGDAALKTAGAAVDVRFDTATNQFSFVSREYGSISKVSFTEASAEMADLGIASGLVGTDGVDVKGTINGQDGFGAGNVLLPALDSAAYGLNLSVSEGATAQGAFQISFSRGIAGELSKLIDDFQGAAGVFKTREDGIQKQLDGIKEEVTLLDRRMEGVSARLTAQFTAMERIVGSLKDTGGQLDGLNDRMPFTASS